MKSVMISIKPEWCKFIASGKKTIEVRKTKPNHKTPFKCYIYCTKPRKKFSIGGGLYANEDNLFKIEKNDEIKCSDGFKEWAEGIPTINLNGKVIGEFVCDKIFEIDYGIEEGVCFDGEYQKGFEANGDDNNPTCLSLFDLENYLTNNEGYGWHISELLIYEKPKELLQFCEPCTFNHDCFLCKKFNFEEANCERKFLERPPQSWCYVEV